MENQGNKCSDDKLKQPSIQDAKISFSIQTHVQEQNYNCWVKSPQSSLTFISRSTDTHNIRSVSYFWFSTWTIDVVPHGKIYPGSLKGCTSDQWQTQDVSMNDYTSGEPFVKLQMTPQSLMIMVTGAVLSLHADGLWNSWPPGVVRAFWSWTLSRP